MCIKNKNSALGVGSSTRVDHCDYYNLPTLPILGQAVKVVVVVVVVAALAGLATINHRETLDNRGRLKGE